MAKTKRVVVTLEMHVQGFDVKEMDRATFWNKRLGIDIGRDKIKVVQSRAMVIRPQDDPA